MNTLASDSMSKERSAELRGGRGRKAKFHQTQRKSRLLMIDRERKKQPAKLASQARPIPTAYPTFLQSLRFASVQIRCSPMPASRKTTGNANHGAIRPKIASTVKRRRLIVSGGRGTVSSRASWAKT